MSDNAVAPVEEPKGGALAAYDYSQYAGRGFEDQTADELQIPFVVLLQDLSPQVTGEGDAAVPGAKAGKFFNTVTGEVFDSFTFIPARKEHCFVEWKPRASGGGFVARRELEDPVVLKARQASKEFGKYTTETGNLLVDTIYLYGTIVKEDGTPVEACIAFTSTKLKAYKTWNSQINAFSVPGPNGSRVKPPRFAHKVRVSASERIKGPKGTYYNLVIKPASGDIKSSLLAPSDPAFIAAANFDDMISKGAAKLVDDAVASTGSASSEDDGPF